MKKLYVVVRKDLSKSQQAVQAGHALADYLLYTKNTSWNNGTLVYLTAPNEPDLRNLVNKLDRDNIYYCDFHEPDRGDELTAVASLGSNKYFESMRLL